jgi:CheY-like chemotaxis protein
MKVLLIDDDPIFLMICKRYMDICSFADEIIACENGQKGLDWVKNCLLTGEKLPDFIFLDINMPVMNGWDFLEEVSPLFSNFKTQVHLIILSSTVNQADFEKAKAYPIIQEFFTKPITLEMFIELKNRWVEANSSNS